MGLKLTSNATVLAELRAENEQLRQAHATACAEVSKLAVERDALSQELAARRAPVQLNPGEF